jgi:catechol 2,3-dioxygenase-like lactoylglutathione lyase family enzyme
MIAGRPTIAHVGLSVPDIDAAIDFYVHALGMRLLVPATDVPLTQDHSGNFLEAFFPGFQGMRAARVLAEGDVAIEFFQWLDEVDPAIRVHRDHRARGYFHVAIVDPDVEGRVSMIMAAGGRRRTATWQVWPDRPFLACYCEDPFGNIVEVISHGDVEMHRSISGSTGGPGAP